MKRIREAPSHLDGSPESLLAQFSATTLELNPSLGTAEFGRRLTARTAEMLGARSVVLALDRGSEWEIAALSGPARRWEQPIPKRLAAALAELSTVPTVGLRSGTASALLGRELADAIEWRDVTLLRLVGSDGALLGALCVVDLGRDLSATERQLLEALAGHASVALENVRLFSRVERSRKQWVEDVDAISDFIVVHDHAGAVLRLNRALADLLGARPTEVIGRDIGQLELLDAPVQPGRCPFCRNARVAVEEFIHTAGDRTYLVSTSRIHSAEEEDARTVHVLKDITDRREAERRYRRERDFNRNILNNTQSMILVLDTAGLVSYANKRCFQAGYGEHDLVGHSLAEMVPGARRPLLVEALERTLQGVAVDNLEIPVFRGDGSAGQFSISLSPMRDERGDINSIVVVMTDITDAADLQAKLMHTEKMAALGQLVSGVAHEVNNPLAAIVGFTDLLLENPSIAEEAKEDLRVILQEAQRTRVIVQNLLSFARHVPAHREPVRVNSLLRQTLKLRAYDLSSHGVEIAERYEEDVPLTIGDPHQLQQVFLNILNNAYDAIQEVGRPGRIEIATSHVDGQLEVAFRDNGPGISHPERIFDPFFTTKEVGKGTGLGLSICYGIVRAHRGEIVARNNPDGIGCTFLVRLPVASQAVELFAAEVAP
ncbi:MAG: PAS domain S-box protein [Candidatus Acidiferrales bacterium]